MRADRPPSAFRIRLSHGIWQLVRLLAILLCGVALICPMQDAAPPATYAITVQAQNVTNSRGMIGVLVFNSKKGWPDKPDVSFRSDAVPARQGTTSLTISDLPAGDYAIVVLHDENGNKKMDRNWLGRPKEQWGMSNNPKARFSAPGFNRARFTLRADRQIEVRMSR